MKYRFTVKVEWDESKMYLAGQEIYDVVAPTAELAVKAAIKKAKGRETMTVHLVQIIRNEEIDIIV